MSERPPSSSGSPSWSVYVILSAILTIVGVGTIGYFAIARWMSPLTPPVLGATALTLPLLSLNAVLALVLSTSDQTVVGALRPALAASLAFGLLGTGATAAWTSPDLRHRALSAAADRGMRPTAVGALGDPDDRVVSTACTRLFELGITGHRQPVLELLDAQPALAGRCLTSAPDNPQIAEISQVLTERWHEEILSAQARSPKRSCELARHLPNLPDASEAGIPALLSCTLQAADQAQRCCSKSLAKQVGTGPGIAEELGNTVVRTIAERLAAPLVQASLHQLQMSDEDKARAVRLGLTSDEMKRYSARFACAYTLGSSRTNDVTRQLAAWLDDRSCQATVSNIEHNIRAWHRICGHLVDGLDATDDPADAICRAARVDALTQCRKRAINRVRGAYTGAREQFIQAQILAGVAMKRDMTDGPLGFLADLSSSNRQFDGTLREIMSRMDDDKFRNRIEKITVASSGRLKPGLRKAEDLNDLKLSEEARKKLEQFKEQRKEQMQRLKHTGSPELRNKINLDSPKFGTNRPAGSSAAESN